MPAIKFLIKNAYEIMSKGKNLPKEYPVEQLTWDIPATKIQHMLDLKLSEKLKLLNTEDDVPVEVLKAIIKETKGKGTVNKVIKYLEQKGGAFNDELNDIIIHKLDKLDGLTGFIGDAVDFLI